VLVNQQQLRTQKRDSQPGPSFPLLHAFAPLLRPNENGEKIFFTQQTGSREAECETDQPETMTGRDGSSRIPYQDGTFSLKRATRKKRDGPKLLLICRLTLNRKMPDTRLNVPKKNSAQKATPDSSRHSRAIGAEIINKPTKNKKQKYIGAVSSNCPSTSIQPRRFRWMREKKDKKKYLDLLQLDSRWCSCRAVDNMASFAKAITLGPGTRPETTVNLATP
jgi:hypothetical protein